MSQTAGIAEWWVFFRQTCMPTSDKPSVARRGRRVRGSGGCRSQKSLGLRGNPRASPTALYPILERPFATSRSIDWLQGQHDPASHRLGHSRGRHESRKHMSGAELGQAGYFGVRLGIETSTRASGDRRSTRSRATRPFADTFPDRSRPRGMLAQLGRPPGPAPTESRTSGSAGCAAGGAVAWPSFPAAHARSPRHASRV